MADLIAVGASVVVFHDDNFLVPSQSHNRSRIAEIGAVLDARGVKDVALVLKCSPRDADRTTFEMLRNRGLLRLFMGIESASACGLASIGRRQTVEQNERALAIAESLGISSQYTLIIFHPEATLDSMLVDLDFAARHPAHPLNYCRAEVYPGRRSRRGCRRGPGRGSYLGRTYRYTDPQVALVWETGKDLFAGRCWGKDDLLGRVIRIDHQVAVLDRFYDGRKVRELVRSFRDWQVELNLETAGFFRELVLACGEAAGAADPALALVLSTYGAARTITGGADRQALRIPRSARPVRDGLRRERSPPRAREPACEDARPAPRRRRRGGDRSVRLRRRHDQDPGGSAPPMDKRPPPEQPPRRRRRSPSSAEAEGGPRPPPKDTVVKPDYREDHGVAEAAPPPFPEPLPDGLPYRHDRDRRGCAPPYRHDLRIAEAAPPIDRVPKMTSEKFRVRTTPAVTSRGAGARRRFRMVAGPRTAAGRRRSKAPIHATLRFVPSQAGMPFASRRPSRSTKFRGDPGPRPGW
jgi:hypothetical protein